MDTPDHRELIYLKRKDEYYTQIIFKSIQEIGEHLLVLYPGNARRLAKWLSVDAELKAISEAVYFCVHPSTLSLAYLKLQRRNSQYSILAYCILPYLLRKTLSRQYEKHLQTLELLGLYLYGKYPRVLDFIFKISYKRTQLPDQHYRETSYKLIVHCYSYFNIFSNVKDRATCC